MHRSARRADASSVVNLNSANVPSELGLSLESSLEALAQEDAASVQFDETEMTGEQFDLDGLVSYNADASPQREKARGSCSPSTFVALCWRAA